MAVTRHGAPKTSAGKPVEEKKLVERKVRQAKVVKEKVGKLVERKKVEDDDFPTETTAEPSDQDMVDVEASPSADESAAILSLKVTLTDDRSLPVGDLMDDEHDCVAFVVYPKASTPGCTKQAMAFSAKNEEFKRLGVQVVGLSMDSITAQVIKWSINKSTV